MPGSVILPWLVGEGIFTYRTVKNQKRPPLPGELLGMSGLFALLALLEGPQPQLATLIAWGVDIAALLNLFGQPGANTLATALSGPGTSTNTATNNTTTSGSGTAPSSATITPTSRSGSGVQTV
jgi:hypothetical protein